jgi:muconolactone delta-isomerase
VRYRAVREAPGKGERPTMQFMTTIVFEAAATPEAVVPLLEAERARVAELVRAGAIETMFMTPDRRRGWIVLNAGDEAEARRAVDSLPLRPFMAVELVELGAFPIPGRAPAPTP